MSRLIAGVAVGVLLLVAVACGGDDAAEVTPTQPGASSTPVVAGTATRSTPASPSASVPADESPTPDSTVPGSTAAPTTPPSKTPAQPQPTSPPAQPTAVPPTAIPPTQPSGAPLYAFIGVDDAANRWSPSAVTIRAGGTVTWSWSDGHNLVVPSQGVETGFSSDTTSVTFAGPGQYAFSCAAHQRTMTGWVTVE